HWLARLAVRLVLAAERAVLAELQPVRVVAPVLPGDVVAVLALLTGQGDLGPDVSRSHDGVPFSCRDISVGGQLAALVFARGSGRKGSGLKGNCLACGGKSRLSCCSQGEFVAEAGLEPATQRL